MTDRKTERKNKTGQTVLWPSHDEYFTIASLLEKNQHMLTQSKSDITLRVRLKKAIDEDNIVAEIGDKNVGKGRPIKAFAMTPVTQTALDEAAAAGITLKQPSVVPVIQINPSVENKTPVNVMDKSVAIA